SWNQYLWPTLFTHTDYARPIAVAIATFFGQDSIYCDRAMAASVLMMIPVLILYLAFQLSMPMRIETVASAGRLSG
ncbi:hypothetical protein ACC785_39225, partial [Rhizobium ruizarguesonis]